MIPFHFSYANLAQIAADGPSEDSLKKESLKWESTEPPRSKIRERLRAWEQEQKRLAELDPAVAADFHSFQIGTELDLPDEQELQKQKARDEEEDDDTPYEHRDLVDGDDQPEFIGGKLKLRPGDIVSSATYDHQPFCVQHSFTNVSQTFAFQVRIFGSLLSTSGNAAPILYATGAIYSHRW